MSIPEFILNKMIVPGSFKSNNSGFTFKILDTFAPATISRFSVQVGNLFVPDKDVSFTISGQPARLGTTINLENPAQLPLRTEVTIDVRLPAGDQPVRLIATTKEVGEISMTLSAGKSLRKSKELKPFIFSNFTPTKTAEFSIFTDQIIGEASPFILGQFVEHLERCVYDGIWTADGTKLRTDTLDLIKQLNPPLIRYPGGNFASGYHWEDGIGPRNKRPSRHDLAWKADESNQVGTDEFLAFCEEIGAEPVLVVNDGSGSPDEAARWVSYCNSPDSTEQGEHRAQNGHPEPYTVKYWGIGNEVWGPWQIGTTSASQYVKRARKFIKEMKAVDPTIKVIAVGQNPLSDDPEEEASLWNELVLRELGSEIDYLSWHIYQPDTSDWQEEYDPLELYKSICAAHLDIEKILNRVEDQIQHFSVNNQVLQAVDEWNLWLPPREKNVSMHSVSYTLRDSLYITSVLITFFKHCKTVGMANLAQLVNVLPLIITNRDSAIATAIFAPFVMFNQVQPVVLRTVSKCETFDSKAQSINLAAHDHVPYLEGLATLNSERTKMTLVFVNRYPLNRLRVNLQFEKELELNPINALQIHAPTPGALNSFSSPNKIHISDASLPAKKGGVCQLTLQPCSVYFVEFEVKSDAG